MLNGGNVAITDSLFLANGDGPGDYAIRDVGVTSLTVSGCHFDSNTGRAALVAPWSIGGFSMNSFAGNGVDRVRIASGSTIDGGSRARVASRALNCAGRPVGPGVYDLHHRSGRQCLRDRFHGGADRSGTAGCLGTEPIVMTSFDDTPGTLWDGVTFNGSNATGLLRWTSVRRGGE